MRSHLEDVGVEADVGRRWWTRRWRILAMALGLLALCAAGGTWLASRSAGKATADVGLAVPSAPQLQALAAGQQVYRIDASRSSMRYSITETLAGSDRIAEGTTAGIAGDVVVDDTTPSASRIGDIVVNVEQLTSDHELRDRRLRADYLESSRFPLATFHPTRLHGLPSSISEGVAVNVHADGELTLKGTTRPVAVDAAVTRTDGELHMSATSSIRLSDFGIGPISIVGFVKTGDDVQLTFQLTAVEAGRGVPTYVAAPSRPNLPATGGDAPSFQRDIKPVLEERCASCHTRDGVGSHTWTLATAADARSAATGLSLVASSGYMPPWPATGEGVAFEHDRRLSPEEIRAIASWAQSGAPLDIDPATPVRATRDASGPTIRHDVTMTLPEPYQATVDRPDDYRCFVLDPKLDRETYITGFEFTPDQTAIVHHATLAKVTAPGRGDVAALDAATGGSGWSCALGAPLTVSTEPGAPAPSSGGRSSQVSAWAPGQAPTTYPDGVGLRMEPGDFFLIQIHYHVAHTSPPDRSRFSIQVETDSQLDDVNTASYFAPAEIPCREEQHAPLCDRDAVLAELATNFGPSAPLLPVGILTACGTTPETYSTMTNGTARASCTQPVTNVGQILWVMGHEHEIGASFRLTINAGRPDERVLLDIPRWSFAWQLVYRPQAAIELKSGDTITTECSWDRSLRPDRPPRYITWAEGTGDEMCMGIIATRATR